MSFFRLIDKGNGPTRLFVGGVHGKEGLSTIHALKKIQSRDVPEGKLIIYNCDTSKYISTLDKKYYQTPIGKEIIHLIRYYKPEVYVEPHCYHEESYRSLTDLQRKEKIGVPPLIELEKGVLIGSVSPFIRTSLFKREDVCLTLEMPCINNPDHSFDQELNLKKKLAFDLYVDILKKIALAQDRKDLENKMSEKYPLQVKRARKYAREFFGEYPPF